MTRYFQNDILTNLSLKFRKSVQVNENFIKKLPIFTLPQQITMFKVLLPKRFLLQCKINCIMQSTNNILSLN